MNSQKVFDNRNACDTAARRDSDLPRPTFSHEFAIRTPDTMRSMGPVLREDRLTRIVRWCTHIDNVRDSRD